MKELISFILKNILGNDEFEIEEVEDNGKVSLNIQAKPENIGLIIGKGGQTIKAIQNVVKVKARLENKFVTVNVTEAQSVS